ncbi:hypothetical protein [Mycobacterium sp. SMC-13]|uniref:hypothetical protein n=1 Tax=Mycobacterium sp. SMC-13 TaxID=3381626 RepID=UPI003876EA80
MNLTHPDSPDVKAALETKCRHCSVAIVYLEQIEQWWHTVGPIKYRGCRDKTGHLTGKGHAEPEEKQ